MRGHPEPLRGTVDVASAFVEDKDPHECNTRSARPCLLVRKLPWHCNPGYYARKATSVVDRAYGVTNPPPATWRSRLQARVAFRTP